MNRRGIWSCMVIGFTLMAFMLLLTSCAKPTRKPEAALDTPEHHVFSGNKLLDKGDYAGAQREFVLAIQLDKKYSPAYVGLGLAYGMQNSFDAAFENMKKGKSLAKTPDEKVNAHVGMIRLYSMERKEKWINKAEDEFEDAIKIQKKRFDAPEAAASKCCSIRIRVF